MSDEGSAWFYHFWPWFIVGLLTVSVVGSLATVMIAFNGADIEIPRHSTVEARPHRDEIPAAAEDR